MKILYVRCHFIHKVIMSEYQFAEWVSHIRLTASKIEMKKLKILYERTRWRIHIYMIIATLAAENSNKQTLRIKKQEHELCRIKLFYHL